MKKILYLFFFLSTFAQAQNHVPKQFLVLLEANADLPIVLEDLAKYQGKNTELRPLSQPIPDMPIWLLEYENSSISEETMLELLDKHPAVVIAQYNHKIQLRSDFSPQSTLPNDPQFSNQWQYLNTGQGGGTVGMDIAADLAWDISTGGLTSLGDTIVIAVIDDGAQISHPDLQGNIWINHAEIPNNALDDDGNGYIDDFWGWNSNTLDDNVDANGAGTHGTPVAGIVGASGNNNTGVAGVNWHIKIMLIRNNFNTNEENVLAAYGYALTQRKIYNQTNGQAGAFVVATNASWGIDNGQPAQAPLWCAFYDTLGKHGILNAAATTNNNVNVNTVGDLPTACPSDYLISVTNLNRFGTLFGGHGSTTIDLGAFGDGVFTLTNGSSYGSFGGTSAASPHVAGAIGLVYSAVCPDFISLARLHPQQAALQVKQFILNSVTPMNNLSTITTSGGRLNLQGALLQAQAGCPIDSCFAPYGLTLGNVTDASATLNWLGVSSDSVQLSLRFADSTNWLDSFYTTTQLSYTFSNLADCKAYTARLTGICNGSSGNSIQIDWQTDGCCLPPSNFQALGISNQNTTLSWQAVAGASSYWLRWRVYGGVWDTILVSGTSHSFSNLTTCTFYQAQLMSDCGDTLSGFSNILVWSTTGCSSCADVNYCSMGGSNSSIDWIESFEMGDFFHRSGNNGGYHIYDSTFIVVSAGEDYSFTLTQGNDFQEAVRIWIDFNRDGDFSDGNELVYEGLIPSVSSIAGAISIPWGATQGITRLRVGMQWNVYPSNCSQYQNGETEDYCIQILPPTAISVLNSDRAKLQLYPNPNTGHFWLDNLPKNASLLVLSDVAGRILWQKSLAEENISLPYKIELPENMGTGLYFLTVQGTNKVETLKLSVE